MSQLGGAAHLRPAQDRSGYPGLDGPPFIGTRSKDDGSVRGDRLRRDHSGQGVVCLEVKGGRVSCESGVWSTVNRHGKSSALGKSPFMQARESMFTLRDAIAGKFGHPPWSREPPSDAGLYSRTLPAPDNARIRTNGRHRRGGSSQADLPFHQEAGASAVGRVPASRER